MESTLNKVNTKFCNFCYIDRPLDAFKNDKQTKDGKYYKCKECESDARFDKTYTAWPPPMVKAEWHNEKVMDLRKEIEGMEIKRDLEVMELRSILRKYIKKHGSAIYDRSRGKKRKGLS